MRLWRICGPAAALVAALMVWSAAMFHSFQPKSPVKLADMAPWSHRTKVAELANRNTDKSDYVDFANTHNGGDEDSICAHDAAALAAPALALGEWVALAKRCFFKGPVRGEIGFNQDVREVLEEHAKKRGNVVVRPYGGMVCLGRFANATASDAFFVEEVHLPVGGTPFEPVHLPVRVRVCASVLNGTFADQFGSWHVDASGTGIESAGSRSAQLSSVLFPCTLEAHDAPFVDLLCKIKTAGGPGVVNLVIAFQPTPGRLDTHPLLSSAVAVALRIDQLLWKRSHHPEAERMLSAEVRKNHLAMGGDWRPDATCPLTCRWHSLQHGAGVDDIAAFVLSVAGGFRQLPDMVKKLRVPVIMLSNECLLHAEYSRFGHPDFMKAVGTRWVSSYAHDSSIPNFGSSRRQASPIELFARSGQSGWHYNASLARSRDLKSTEVSFISSTCREVRTAMIVRLMQHIAVDSLGQCLNNRDKDIWIKQNVKMSGNGVGFVDSAVMQKQNAQRRYAFCLAIDNCSDRWYATQDKAFECIASGSIPLYWGAPNMPLLLPSAQAAIFIDAYASMAALAAALKTMEKVHHHAWRQSSIEEWNPPFARSVLESRESLDCRFCRAAALQRFWRVVFGITKRSRDKAAGIMLCEKFYSAYLYRD